MTPVPARIDAIRSRLSTAAGDLTSGRSPLRPHGPDGLSARLLILTVVFTVAVILLRAAAVSCRAAA